MRGVGATGVMTELPEPFAATVGQFGTAMDDDHTLLRTRFCWAMMKELAVVRWGKKATVGSNARSDADI